MEDSQDSLRIFCSFRVLSYILEVVISISFNKKNYILDFFYFQKGFILLVVADSFNEEKLIFLSFSNSKRIPI